MERSRRKPLRSNDEIRRYVIHRDKNSCQWPGCKESGDVDVLFIVETNDTNEGQRPVYDNGVMLCPKHMEMVNLHGKTFGPLIYDLIRLVEFENDLEETEQIVKDILK